MRIPGAESDGEQGDNTCKSRWGAMKRRAQFSLNLKGGEAHGVGSSPSGRFRAGMQVGLEGTDPQRKGES